MGLIKAAVGAVGSTLHDQWKEAIRCEDMPNDVLMVKRLHQMELFQMEVLSL